MFAPLTVVAVIALYMGILFVCAQLAERTSLGRRWASSPTVYALGLAVYCTTWTYYGSVGRAAVSGMAFLPVYLGPSIALLVGGTMFKRIIELKLAHKVTSIADFISARYGKSQLVAALVTVILGVGIVPYMALQMKAVTGTFVMITAGHAEAHSALASWFGPLVVVAMIAFTILFGIRHIDPTERHPGMVVSLAAESLVKLVAFLAAGAFVLGAAFGGVSGFAREIEALPATAIPMMGKSSGADILTYVTVTCLSMAAFAFLPRQFHVGVVESSVSSHVKKAQWLTPLYMILINVFVIPLALGGKRMAAAGTSADFYVLALPLQAGKAGLSLAVFVGGFSAAIGMIMVESMTMSTMIGNHLVLPVLQAVPALRPLRRRMLQVRWAATALITFAGYEFAMKVGGSYMLVAIGLISFAAAFLLAPIVVGALYWRRANRAGALMGLSAGFVSWFYTLLMPTFVKSHWLPESLLSKGPFGIAMLRPEALFGWTGLPALAHGTMWSILFTITFYVSGSVLFRTGKEERLLMEAFLDGDANQLAHLDAKATLVVREQRRGVTELLLQFFSAEEAEQRVGAALASVGVGAAEKMSAVQAAELVTEIERLLAGAIGAASAHAAMKKLDTFDRKDRRALEREFARALADLKLTPKEMKARIDFQKEREALLTEQFHALEEKITQRDAEILERQKAEVALQRAHGELEQRVVERTRELRAILDNVVFGFLCVGRDLVVGDGFTNSCKELLDTAEIATRDLADLLRVERPAERNALAFAVLQVFDDELPEALSIAQLPDRFVVSGRTLRVEARVVRNDAGQVGVLLITISDITALESAQRENEHNRALLNILRQRSSFEAFLQDTKEQLRAARGAMESGDDTRVRRVAHTIKGNASLYGVSEITRLIHEIEEQPRIGREHFDEIEGAFRQFLDAHAVVLGLSYDAKVTRSYVITEAQLSQLRELIGRLPANDRDRAGEMVHDLERVPASELLGPVAELVESLGARLGKEVAASVSGSELKVEERLAPLFHVLPHLLRNAVDHGIEAPEERGEKLACARVLVSVVETPSGYSISVTDDGRGIDVERVVAAALRNGVVTAQALASMTYEQRLALIFEDEVSTATAATDVSGRGVGMAAIRAEVVRLGGEVMVFTRPGEGTRIELSVPKAQREEAPISGLREAV